MGLSAKFQGFSRVLSHIYIYMIIDLLLVPFQLLFCVLLEILCPLLEQEVAYHTKNDTLFHPNKLIGPPPLRYRNKKCNSTTRPKFDAWPICFRT